MRLFHEYYATHSTHPILISEFNHPYALSEWKKLDDGRLSMYATAGDWCNMLRTYIASAGPAPILLVQEDVWLTSPVSKDSISYAIEQMRAMGAGCVRLYPCPGADEDYGDPYIGMVMKGIDYRISCAPAVWNPSYLLSVLRRIKGGPADFEISGTKAAESLEDPVLAWKREVVPWPLEVLYSAISRGKWNPDAKVLCDAHGITAIDWGKRGFDL